MNDEGNIPWGAALAALLILIFLLVAFALGDVPPI